MSGSEESEEVSWLKEAYSTKPSGWEEEQTAVKQSSSRSAARQSSSARPNAGSSSKTGFKPSVEERAVREKNKQIKLIFLEEGIPYPGDTSGAELERQFKRALQLREKSIRGVLDLIRNARNADVCFVVDSTGSMCSHIREVREKIGNILDYLMGRNSAQRPIGSPCEAVANRIRLSFVGYGDYPDPNGRDNVFIIQGFTDSESLFRQKLASASVLTSGYDIVEDVFGGLNKSLQQDWSPESGTKVIFHIGDRPGHGLMYHNLGSGNDSYPHGDPSGLTPKILFDQMKEYGIDYYFGRILPDTDKMLEIFDKEYGRSIVQFHVKDFKNIQESVMEAVTSSVASSISKSTMVKSGAMKTIRAHVIVPNVPDWDQVGKVEGTQIRYEYPESIDALVRNVPLTRRKPARALLKIADHPFDKGSERLAYYARDVTYDDHVDMVVKESLHMGPGQNAAIRYEASAQLQTVAAFLVREYMNDLKKHHKNVSVKFIKTKTLCLPMNNGKTRFMSSERRYGDADKFIRFTNNTDYGMLESKAISLGVDVEVVRILMAFSHWSFQKTNKNFMVVDLQGIITKGDKGKTEVLLTDPAIHCSDLTRFNRMNHGPGGMNNFFNRHTCNDFCKLLNLFPVSSN